MTKDFLAKVKALLNALGKERGVDYDLTPYDENIGPRTVTALELELAKREAGIPPAPQGDRPVNPAYQEAKKHAGKGENNSAFVAWLSKFWGKVGLPNYKTIIGASFAWCGLFVAAMNTETGLDIVKGAAGAKNWAVYGVEIDWRKNGIPKGSVLHINHAGNCKSGSGNHVGFADGDCSVADLTKAGATVPVWGGNQSNTVKRSNFAVKEVCEVRWPAQIEKPGPVLKSIGCTGSSSGDTTK